MGDYPYEVYFTMLQELIMFKDQNTSLYVMLRELACHFHLGIDVTSQKGASIWCKKWAEYFFANVDGLRPAAINDISLIEELKRHLE